MEIILTDPHHAHTDIQSIPNPFKQMLKTTVKSEMFMRGCIDVFWETADTYQAPVIALVAITCLIQVSQIIATCYNRIVKSNKSNNKITDQRDIKNYKNVSPSKNNRKLGMKNTVYSEEKMWYPEVERNNYISPHKHAWDTESRNESFHEGEKWYSGVRRELMKRPNRSLVMDI
ncbi:uncharacterized protein LOC134722378 [Mytilus trossulus]|uniref:uncharacterized protein LOC134722378 n=1 Tax=Mytilus trossulus TaxID=6551 RepID=UPI0030076F5D